LFALTGIILIAAATTIVTYEEAEAIPAFARKYRMSCTTCHAPIPRLKDYGDDFAGNGFVLEDQDAPRYYVETGDTDLDLIRDFPIAVRMDGFIQHQTYSDKGDMSLPYNLKLLSGGAVTENIAYYFYFYMSEHGEVAGVEDAYLMFNNLFDSELDIYLGQFQVSDPLFKRELRLTYEDYPVYKLAPGNSNINLTYDRGVMLTYGFETGTDVIAEIINGNGLVEAGDLGTFDHDKYKSVVGRISQGIGEYIRLGVFGYYGKEESPIDSIAAVSAPNEVWLAGPDMTLSYQDKVQLNLQYLERRDDNPFFAMADSVPSSEIESRGGMAELIIMPDGARSKYYGVVLYNKIESDVTASEYETITGHVGYLVRTNLRLIAENTWDITNEENRAVIGFVSAF
jgi:hypothetical protein